MNSKVALTLIALCSYPATAQSVIPATPGATVPASPTDTAQQKKELVPFKFNPYAMPDLSGQWKLELAAPFFESEKNPTRRSTLVATVLPKTPINGKSTGEGVIRVWLEEKPNNTQQMYGNFFTGVFRLRTYDCKGEFRAEKGADAPSVFVANCGLRGKAKNLPVKLVRVENASLPQ